MMQPSFDSANIAARQRTDRGRALGGFEIRRRLAVLHDMERGHYERQRIYGVPGASDASLDQRVRAR